MELELKEM